MITVYGPLLYAAIAILIMVLPMIVRQRKERDKYKTGYEYWKQVMNELLEDSWNITPQEVADVIRYQKEEDGDFDDLKPLGQARFKALQLAGKIIFYGQQNKVELEPWKRKQVKVCRTYGNEDTIHKSRFLDVETHDGDVVAVWFRCQALPFLETKVGDDRANEMDNLTKSGQLPELISVRVLENKESCGD